MGPVQAPLLGESILRIPTLVILITDEHTDERANTHKHIDVAILPRSLLKASGADFVAAAWPLMLLLPMLPLRFLNTGYGTVLTAFDRQSIRTRGVFYAAVFNVAAVSNAAEA